MKRKLLSVALVSSLLIQPVVSIANTVETLSPIKNNDKDFETEDAKLLDSNLMSSYNSEVSQEKGVFIPSEFTIIKTVEDLQKINENLNGNYVLANDLDLSTIPDFYIGSVNKPFTGTFDGSGYTIRNLTITASAKLSGGLFVRTENATISNLNISNASVRSNFTGGILVGKMIGGALNNVSIMDSNITIDTINEGVSLIDNTGLYGGGLVGILESGRIYNSETIRTNIGTNVSQIIGGVEFGDLHLGGLVGKNSQGSIDNSRSLDGKVINEVDTSISALSGKELYAGGLVGIHAGSILNSYSNNYVKFDGRIYVSVGAGINGFAGGIAGKMTSGSIQNSHYAGKLESYLYNAILIIPVILNNSNLGGLVGNASKGVENNVISSYFNWENAKGGQKDPDIPAIRGVSNTQNYKDILRSEYTNKKNFENWDFDNVWVIDGSNEDITKQMPIHGKNSNVNIDTDGDGKPDLNIDIDGDGIPNINIDTDGDGIPNINIDTDGDGKPDVNVDTDEDGKADININNNVTEWNPNQDVDVNGNGTFDYDTDATVKPNVNIDTTGDGKPDVNVDTDEDGKADINISNNVTEWNPNQDVDVNGSGTFDYDTDATVKPNVNIDTTGDGKPDVNIDTDGDLIPDVNVDIDGDGIPNINIDTDGDGIPNINIDTDGDGKPDVNVDTDEDGKADININNNVTEWNPNQDVDVNENGTFDYDTDATVKPNVNIDTTGDEKPDVNIDTDGDLIPDVNVDIDGDLIPDVNIDTDGDLIPDVNVDTTGDGKPDVNVDTDGDGKADYNIITPPVEWNPGLNIDTTGDGKPNYDTDANYNPVISAYSKIKAAYWRNDYMVFDGYHSITGVNFTNDSDNKVERKIDFIDGNGNTVLSVDLSSVNWETGSYSENLTGFQAVIGKTEFDKLNIGESYRLELVTEYNGEIYKEFIKEYQPIQTFSIFNPNDWIDGYYDSFQDLGSHIIHGMQIQASVNDNSELVITRKSDDISSVETTRVLDKGDTVVIDGLIDSAFDFNKAHDKYLVVYNESKEEVHRIKASNFASNKKLFQVILPKEYSNNNYFYSIEIKTKDILVINVNL